MRTEAHARATKQEGAVSAVLGLACNQGFVFSLFYLGENRALGQGAGAFERADLVAMLLCMLLSFALLRAASARARAAALSRPLLWCYAWLLVLGSVIPLMTGSSAGGVLAEGLLVGAPAGLMLAAWGRALGARPADRAAREVFAGFGAAAVACLLVFLVPVPQAELALKLCPLGSAWALGGLPPASERAAASSRAANGDGAHAGGSAGAAAPSADGSDDAGAPPAAASASFSFSDLLATKEQRDQTVRLSRKMIAGTCLFGVAAGFMETFGSDPGMPSTPSLAASLLLLALFCAAALQLLGAGEAVAPLAEMPAADAQSPLDGVYRLAVLVMMAGFLFVPVLGSFGVPGESIVLAGYLGLTCVLASLFLVMGRLTSQDAALSFARGFSALYAGEVAGVVLGNVIELAEPAGQIPYAIAAFAGLAALFSYLFLFTDRDFKALSVIVDDVDRFDDACRAIAGEHGLSKRESEILPLALRGRTSERIAAEFCISKSTVDTHLRRIYAKTGTHGRQELIDLGECTLQRLSGR